MPVTNDTERFQQGLATRRSVLGEAYVERALANTTPFDEPFQSLITEAAWGHLWSRPNWSQRERSIITIALLAGLGHFEEMGMHIRATLRTGATREDVTEALMHVAIYTGVPNANQAFKVAKQAFADIDAGRVD